MKHFIYTILCILAINITIANGNGLKLGEKESFNQAGEFNISVQPVDNGINILIPSMDADKYGIYRSEEKDGEYKLIKVTKENSYIDKKIKPGVKYYYVVVSLVKSKHSEKIESDGKGKNKIKEEKSIWEKIYSNKASAEPISMEEEESIVLEEESEEIESTTPIIPPTPIKEQPKTETQAEVKKKETPAPAPEKEIIKDVLVSFKSEPSGATVIINNENIGETPVKKNFKLGTYQLTIQKENYEPYRNFNFVVDYKKEINFEVNLKKLTGAIQVITTPPNAEILLGKKKIGDSPLTKTELDYGIHTIKAILKDYNPVEITVKIDSQNIYPVNITFEKSITYGSIKISSIPSGAQIFIDNKLQGETPKLIEQITTGIHTLTLKKADYNDIENNIVIEMDKTKEFYFTLKKENGFLNISTFPDKANCYLNNNFIGQAPIKNYPVDIGTYNLSISKENYDNFNEVIKINPGEDIRRDIILSQKKSTIIINTIPDKAKIFINEIDYGYTPFISDNIQPGNIKLAIKKGGYKDIEQTFTLSPGESKNLTYNLTPVITEVTNTKPETIQNGTLSIISSPPYASIYINDKYRGVTPSILSLNTGTYRVKIDMPNYQEYITAVTISPNKMSQVNAQLISRESYLSIKSIPTGAEIYINNTKYGITPLLMKIASGEYVLNLNKNGYEVLSDKIIITGTPPTLNKVYLLKEKVIKYSFTSVPSGAEVLINNRIVGITPFEHTSLKDGEYIVQFRKPGYILWEKSIQFSKGVPSTINARLQALLGNLLINSNPLSCDIYFDNQFLGRTGNLIQNIPAGFHKLVLKKYGYYDATDTVRIYDKQTTTKNFSLVKKPTGNIQVDSIPPGANVYLNRRYKGITPLLMRDIPEDNYRIRIKKKGYRSYYKNVFVRGNQTEYIQSQLIKGSDCCILNSAFAKPSIWYITSAVCLIGSGYAWYEEDKALKSGDMDKRHKLHETRNTLAYASGLSLMVGITFYLAE